MSTHIEKEYGVQKLNAKENPDSILKISKLQYSAKTDASC